MSEVETHYFDNGDTLNAIFAGNLTANLKETEEKLSVKLVARDCWVKIEADRPEELKRTVGFLNELTRLYSSSLKHIDQCDFDQVLLAFRDQHQNELHQLFSHKIKVSPKKRDIVPRNQAQLQYLKNIHSHDIVFGIGPAGTGKTYLAMAMAVSALLQGTFSRIILTRPAIEAGENLGFLPGNLEEKIMPYLRPLYDALYDMVEFEEASAMIEKNIIEIAPLAFMRGRTLNNAFIILDEAQNTTSDQMLMFLTRLGFNSRCVITGDPSQTDLPSGMQSGLVHASHVLESIKEIQVSRFSARDVVRHSLVEKIINAYEAHSQKKEK